MWESMESKQEQYIAGTKPDETAKRGRVGRDPREMTNDELIQAGHEKKPLLKAIREKCLDCSGHQPYEVLYCPVVACALWPFRMNENPWREKREYTEEELKALRERFALSRKP